MASQLAAGHLRTSPTRSEPDCAQCRAPMQFRRAIKDPSVPMCVVEMFECPNCHLKETLRVLRTGAKRRRILIALGGF